MTKIISQIALIILIASSSSFSLDADKINSDAGTSAFPFLKINISARAVAMGGAFTGLADDESSLYYNPAGIASIEDPSFIAGYHNYFSDIQTGFIGIIKNSKEKYFYGGYLSYLNYGSFIQADQFGTVTGEFSGSDIVLAGTFAIRHSYSYMSGATFKIIYESLQDFTASGIAIDLGFKYLGDRGKRSLGFAIQNLGTQLSSLGNTKYSLPLTFRFGGSISPQGLPLLISTDLIIPTDNSLVFAFGMEYLRAKPLYLRMGWNSFGSNFRGAQSTDSWAGFALGFGFDYNEKQISYSFTPGAELGSSHRITITGGL